ncbi:MAG: type I DNA topoisomerase [Candidatus Omnitrophica bacterium]|nr:type I DNA topoisomerase [Candidatus Omnitrophota bacterium]
MAEKSLVIVESPTKAKTISRILGKNYQVLASMGHVIDLPEKTLGVDIPRGFIPSYNVLPGKKKILNQLKKSASDVEKVYIATDPDREGEAIGWHIKEEILKDKDVKRVTFHQITSEAVREAFTHPRDFDSKMVEAQIARRILDRIVGYYLSPLLWKKVARGLSAGRVQSVALRLIVEREKLIQAFIPQQYWQIEARLKKKETDEKDFIAKLEKKNSEKLEIKTKDQALAICEELEKCQFIVQEVKYQEKNRYPEPPFTTSTLQQEAFNKLRFNAVKTMLIAQQLYEGIDIAEETPIGLITYMRTDSTNLAPEAVEEARKFILDNYGINYLPEEPPVYKNKKFAQEAHEAIRPTRPTLTPDKVRKYLNDDQYRLYELIYRRFMASQMRPARFKQTSVEIKAGDYLFYGTASELIFDGFLRIYPQSEDTNKRPPLPLLEEGEVLQLLELLPSEHFTKPPARFSDSSLVKVLEEEGIGRPSTYAPIISTLIQRGYVHRVKGYLHPTELGMKVTEMLIHFFPEIMDVKFTAAMEEELDAIEEGTLDRLKVLNDFYAPFKASFDFAAQNMQKEVVLTQQICEKCGRPLVIKWGKKGKFLSCSGFPECKFSKSISTGIKCPQPGCNGQLVQRRSPKGYFYGCSQYPKCTYITKNLPEENPDLATKDGQVS